ncbi:hypothetical protein AX16_002509 [Volvariella volvacea WC 439]|nr:hypothetical protein AX16_002509 [Volvariella volvacea WC 439]
MAHHHGGSEPPAGSFESSYPQLNYGAGAKWIKSLTRSRLNNFEGGHFSDINLSSVLFTHRLDSAENVKLQVWNAPGLTKPTFEEAMQQRFKPAKKGDSFGPSGERLIQITQFLVIEHPQQTNHWWKITLIIPESWHQYERVQFEFDPGCEAMVYTTDGTPLQGITGGYGGDRRVDYIIPLEARKAGVHEIVIESSCNGMFGVPWNGDTIQPPDMNRYFRLASADLVVPNQEAWRLLWDFHTLKQIADSVPGNTPLQNKALVVSNQIMNIFNRGDPAAIKEARKLVEEVFGEGWEDKQEEIYNDEHAISGKPLVWGIGDCHIDTAWLWPYRVTQQKVARSWSTQVDLMERYPEHRFAASSAQQYKWLEQLYPKLFDRVKEKVEEGKFHLVGGAWVEHDANMPSGEALVRQFLYGQRFFETRFGKRCDTAWLPDSFGLTGAFPQLIRGAGMKYFFTQKLSCNVFPHSTFNWVGIDGTQVLCHMTPVDTYTAQATVGDVAKGLNNHKNIESSDKALLVFGNGDGGGGPLSKMLENLRRIRAVNNKWRELPPISMGHSVDEFFETLEKETNAGARLPNWHGELYLEFHRGTYTSHGSIKKGNRHSEILLRDVEHVATLASLQNPAYVYPKKGIDDAWEKVLLNQFHDVLPGSAIGMVYEDAEVLYSEVRKEGEKILEEAFDVLFPSSLPLSSLLVSPSPSLPSSPFSSLGRSSLSLSWTSPLAKSHPEVVAFNTTFFPRMDILRIPLGGGVSPALRGHVLQTSEDGKTGYAVVWAKGAGKGVLKHPAQGLHEELSPVSVYSNGSDHFVLRNSGVQLTILGGRITSLLDVKLGRELIPAGQTGGLVIFQDIPNYWDAWDVEIHHLETAKPLEFQNVSVVEQGPLRAAVRAELKYGQSTISAVISLDALSATVKQNSRSYFNFSATVDWHQRHEFLKFELPLNIQNTHATYETQFGFVQRPTHKNTTWDMAKFEVCGHKYADYSEFGYGVAILSESKYGFSCTGNILRISLLRAATAPDAEQDQGLHHFSWAVLPHQGHFLESDVPQAAYLYNSPMRVRCLTPGSSHSVWPLDQPFSVVGASNIFLETFKRGEDDTFSWPTDTLQFDPSSDYENESEFSSDHAGAEQEPRVTSVVLRLYEAFGGHAKAKLRIRRSLGVAKALITNLLEDEIEGKEVALKSVNENSVEAGADFPGSYDEVALDFHPFEVKTVKLLLKDAKAKRESWVSVDGSTMIM